MGRRDRLLRNVIHDRFMFTLDSGEAFDGLLLDVDDAHATFVDANHVSATGKTQPVDGELWVPRARILYMQKIST